MHKIGEKNMIPDIPFNKWSKERIALGLKCCTSRTKKYNVVGVTKIERMKLQEVRDYLWRQEGANSPQEFEKVWVSIHPGKGFDPEQLVYVHWFDNSREEGHEKCK